MTEGILQFILNRLPLGIGRFLSVPGALAVVAATFLALSTGSGNAAPASDASAGSSSAPATAAASGKLNAIKKRGTLIIGIKYDTPPYGWLNPQTNTLQGFDVDYARALTKRIMGSPDAAVFKKVSSASRIIGLQQNDVDIVIATFSITPAREKVIDFSIPYFPAGDGIAIRDGESITGIKDLAGKTNCITVGSSAQESLLKVTKAQYGFDNIKVKNFPTYSGCVEALKAGRVDFMVADQPLLLGLAAETSGIKVLKDVIDDDPWGIGVAKGNPALLTAVNAAIIALYRDGTWGSLYQKWDHQAPPADWAPPGAR